MKISKVLGRSFVGMFCYAFLSMQAVYGDDTEIYFAPKDDVENVIPNILFVIDTSGSMRSTVSGGSQSRINVVKEVMDEVLTNINNVNVGLMRYNRASSGRAPGGPILFPVTFIDDPADPSVSALIVNGNDDGEEDSSGTVVLNTTSLTVGKSGDFTALRFSSLLVPQGATITSANLVFTAKGDSSNVASFVVDAELVADSAVLDNASNSISTRRTSPTTNQLAWIPESWTGGEPYATTDLSHVVQEVVNLAGWCGGNAMTFFITGDAERVAYSLEGSIADSDENNFYLPPQLKIKFENTLPVLANGCTAVKTTSQLVDTDHDWENYHGTFRNWYSSNWFYGNGSVDGMGVSFENLNIPKDANVTDAYITFISATNGGSTGNVVIKGVDPTSSDATDYSDLVANANKGDVAWSFGNWDFGKAYITPSITSVVQNIVNDGDWSLGNTMSFYLKGSSGWHEVAAAEAGTTISPKLTVLYESTYVPGIITKREEMKTAVAGLPANSWTPISDTMAEAGRYFRGDKVGYGVERYNIASNRTSHKDSFDATGFLDTPAGCTDDNYSASVCKGEKIVGDPNYISPITESCQSSHIVFLTDGEPTSHHTATNDIYTEWTNGGTCDSSNYGSGCAKSIAYFLAHSDQNETLDEKQFVNTHTIGFGIDFDLLRDMAFDGGGKSYTADTKDDLIEVLEKIVDDVSSVNSTFVSSGVSVNENNRLTHNEELYFALFAPAAGSVWPGNLKRYELSGNQVIDIGGSSAVTSTGEFSLTAESWWSGFQDGKDVGAGGAASARNYGRNVYSNISGNYSANLTWGQNAVRKTNSSVTESMLGATDSADRDDILDWAQGLKIGSSPSEAHHLIGDPLHSQPTLVIYNTASSGTTIKTKIYMGTNHGFLHSFDSETGIDEWSFIPQELLTNLSDIQKDKDVARAYGIDGNISTYIDDTNNNGVVDVAAGEKAYLYVGMRRGGSSYYAFDISDPATPILKFVIDPSVTGFGSLGQTWSTPIIKRMNIGGQTDRLVMLFGGGYDTVQDADGTSSNTDGDGNLIYIADAKTGDYLWDSRSSPATQTSSPAAGLLSDMNSVPSDVSALDLDGDGLIDVFYSSDTKAQIFRFDINNSTESITGGKIASLQTLADKENNRRFYYKPDTALIRTTNETFISISIGSGYRAHPLNTEIKDNFYMIKDVGGLSATFDMMINRNNLADITSLVGDADGNGVSDDASVAITNLGNRGWYLTFSANGEKVIEKSLTFNNAVLFTTYVPPGEGDKVLCKAEKGSSRLYAVKVIDGNPYVDNVVDGEFKEDDRYRDLISPGIAPPPQPLFNDEIRLCVGTQCDLGNLLPPTPDGIMGIRWRREPN